MEKDPFLNDSERSQYIESYNSLQKKLHFGELICERLFVMMKKTSLAVLLTISTLLSTTAHADGWAGFAHAWHLEGGAKGAYDTGFDWSEDLSLLRTTLLTVNPGTYIGDQLYLEPNFSLYDAIDPAWSDGSGNGNKWIEANTYVEFENISTSTASFAGTVDAYTLHGDYTGTAFIKVLDPNNNNSLDEYQTYDLSLGGQFSLTADLSGHQGKTLLYGFAISGINANPDMGELGGATVTVIPEPSAYALLLAAASGTLLAFRRRKKSA